MTVLGQLLHSLVCVYICVGVGWGLHPSDSVGSAVTQPYVYVLT